MYAVHPQGPCAYRMMHIHITADELLMLNTGRLLSYLVAPNNTVYKHTLTPGSNVVYPKGESRSLRAVYARLGSHGLPKPAVSTSRAALDIGLHLVLRTVWLLSA